MEVTVQIRVGDSHQEAVHSADPEQTVQSFATSVCEQHDIPENQVIISNEDGITFKMSRKLSYYNIEDGQVLILTAKTDNEASAPVKSCSCNQWWLLAVVAFLIGGAGVAAISFIKVNEGHIPDSYGIVFDAGSSHTQMYIYKWKGGKENGTAVVSQTYTERADGGIADKSPKQASESLLKLIESAKKQIPGSQYSISEIFLGATAGMRLLSERNKTESDAIMSDVRDAFSKSPFSFNEPEKQARIISGKEEGSFGWITVNSLQGNFLPVPKTDTYGSLDLGGASTQITFIPSSEDTESKYQEIVVLYGYNYSVYTHSYLCYGANEARRRYHANLVLKPGNSSVFVDPCLPSGTSIVAKYDDVFEAPCSSSQKPDQRVGYIFEGSGDSDLCHNVTRQLFNFTAVCGHPEHCTFDGVYQPSLHGKFQAFSQFYYTMSYLNMTEESSLQDFREATRELCSRTGQEIKNLVHPASVVRESMDYCFNAHYIDILLTEGYGFNASTWNTITFSNSVQGTDLGWTLGFMTNTSNTITAQKPWMPVSLSLFILLAILFAAFLLLSVMFGCHARQQSGTVHDSYSRLAAV